MGYVRVLHMAQATLSSEKLKSAHGRLLSLIECGRLTTDRKPWTDCIKRLRGEPQNSKVGDAEELAVAARPRQTIVTVGERRLRSAADGQHVDVIAFDRDSAQASRQIASGVDGDAIAVPLCCLDDGVPMDDHEAVIFL